MSDNRLDCNRFGGIFGFGDQWIWWIVIIVVIIWLFSCNNNNNNDYCSNKC